MEAFTLVAETTVLTNQQTQVTLRPASELIKHFIATSRVFETSSLDNLTLDSYANEMTPILFTDFQNMGNVDQSIKNQFQL